MARIRTDEQKADTMQALRDDNERLKLALQNQEAALEKMRDAHLSVMRERMKSVETLTTEQLAWLVDDLSRLAPVYVQLSNYGYLNNGWKKALSRAASILVAETRRRQPNIIRAQGGMVPASAKRIEHD